MTSLEVISAEDTEIAAAIMDEAYRRMIDPATSPLDTKRICTAYQIATLPICYAASDLATRVAHEKGVFAKRELHLAHGITSFGHPDIRPDEDDPIICLTWGQFHYQRKAFEEVVKTHGIDDNPGYFGTRRNLIPYLKISSVKYTNNYSAQSILSQQVTYATRPNSSRMKWLFTTVNEAMSGEYPIGQVEDTSYPRDKWSIY